MTSEALAWIFAVCSVAAAAYTAYTLGALWLEGVKHHAWMEGFEEGRKVCNSLMKDLGRR